MSDEVIVKLKLEVDQAGQQAKAVVEQLNKVEQAADGAGKTASESFRNATKESELFSGLITVVNDKLRKATGIDFKSIIGSIIKLKAEFDLAGQAAQQQAKATTLLTNATTLSARAWGAVTGAVKLFRLALISTGIGAIVVALGALAAALLTTEKGTDALTRVFKPLATVLQRALGLFQEIGFAIINAFKDPQQAVKDLVKLVTDNIINRFKAIPLLFKAIGESITAGLAGDIEGVKKALTDAGQAVIQFGTGIDKVDQNKLGNIFGTALKDGQRLVEIGIELEELAANRELQENRLSRLYAEQLKISTNYNLSAKERETAANNAIEFQRQIADLQLEEVDLLIEQAKIKKAQNSSSRADQKEFNDLLARREKIEEDFLEKTKQVRGQINAIDKAQAKFREDEEKKRLAAIEEQEKLEREAAERRLKLEKEISDQIAQIKAAQSVVDLNEFDQRRAAANDYFDGLINAEGVTAEQIIQIRKLLANELAKIDLDEQAVAIERQQELVDGLRALSLDSVETEVAAVREKYKRLLELAEGNAAATVAIEQRAAEEIEAIYDAAERAKISATAATLQSQFAATATVVNAISQLYKEQGEESKALALLSIALNTASGIAGAVSAGSTIPFPGNLAAIAAGIAAVLTGISQAKQVLSGANSFAEGTDYLQRGNNPAGRDTIPIWADEGEAIIPSKRNKQYQGLAKAFRTGSVDEWVNRYYFKDRLANMRIEHSNVNNVTSSLNDKNIVVGLRHIKRTGEETNYLLNKLAKSNRFKRAG